MAGKPEPRMLDRMRQAIRTRHNAIRTEDNPSGGLDVEPERHGLGQGAVLRSFMRVGKWPSPGFPECRLSGGLIYEAADRCRPIRAGGGFPGERPVYLET